MNSAMELRRRTWIAAVKLALVLSVTAALAAVAVSALGGVPEVAIVLTVIVVAFTASWFQTGRVRRRQLGDALFVPMRSAAGPLA